MKMYFDFPKHVKNLFLKIFIFYFMIKPYIMANLIIFSSIARNQ